MTTLSERIIEHVTAHNNTNAWEFEGYVYIDSMKFARVFLLMALKDFKNLHAEVLHEETEANAFTFGEESTGLVFGGRKTNCNVVRIKLPIPSTRYRDEGLIKYLAE